MEQTRTELSRTADANEKQSIYLASQQEREDAYRLISKLSGRINDTYYEKCLPNGNTLYAAVTGALDVQQNEAYYILNVVMNDPNSIGYDRVKYIESDLKILASILDEYEDISAKIAAKPTPLKSFYVNEYSHMVRVFCDKKWFDEELSKYYLK